MEQFFVIIAIVVYWIVRGVAGAGNRRRLPGQDPLDTESFGSRGPIDVVEATRQKSLDSQARAMEALRRWEAKQGLSRQEPAVQPTQQSDTVPAASRTRAGRKASIAHRTTAERERKKAYAEIAQMLDPGASAGPATPGAKRFKVSQSAARKEPELVPVASPSWEAGVREADQPGPRVAPRAETGETSAPEPPAPPRRGSSGASRLARLETLPLAARAIVYAEILGPPRSLS